MFNCDLNVTKGMVLLKLLDKLFKQISEITNSVSGAILFVSLVLCGLNSLMRSFLSIALIWADEFLVYLYIVGLFLLLAEMAYHESALDIGFIYEKMKKGSPGKIILEIIQWAASMFIACILVYSGIKSLQQVIKFKTIGYSTKIPYSYIYGLLFAAVILWLIYLLCSPFIKLGRRGDKEQ